MKPELIDRAFLLRHTKKEKKVIRAQVKESYVKDEKERKIAAKYDAAAPDMCINCKHYWKADEFHPTACKLHRFSITHFAVCKDHVYQSGDAT